MVACIVQTYFTCRSCNTLEEYLPVACFTFILWVLCWRGNSALTHYINEKISWFKFPIKRLVVGLVTTIGYTLLAVIGSRRQREKPSGAPAFYSHLVLLAQNRTGYKNLIKLSSIGFTEGFYRRPRIDKEVLEAHSEGIVIEVGCASCEVGVYLWEGN